MLHSCCSQSGRMWAGVLGAICSAPWAVSLCFCCYLLFIKYSLADPLVFPMLAGVDLYHPHLVEL